MKKKTALTLIFIMLVSMLAACGEKTSEDANSSVIVEEPIPSIDNSEVVVEDPYPEFVPEENVKPEGDTAATVLSNKFLEIAASEKDMNKIAEELVSDQAIMPLALDIVEATPGYLNGFSQDIKNFNKGIMMIPMIGGQPFASYILETDDVAALTEELNTSVDLRWNICTAADEIMITNVDNLVYVVLAPWSFE